MLSRTGRRSTCARRSARATSSAALAPECTRSAAAPTVVASAAWSSRKFERSAAAGASPASSSSGVRALGRLGEARHRVGEAGSLMDAADADAPAHPRVAVRHADRPALVAGVVERRARRVQGLGGDEVPAAQHAERVADAERRQRAADDLGGGQRLHRGGP